MKMTNRWNQFTYWLWAPVYDATVGRFCLPGQKAGYGAAEFAAR
jgi:hypothetical protein